MSKDLASSLFWLLVSIGICIKSFHLGIGSATNPGTAFFAFLSAGVLGVLSLVLFLRTLFAKRRATNGESLSARRYARGAFVITMLVVYGIVMEAVGYIIATFLLLALFFWIFNPRNMRWLLSSVVLAIIATGASYYLFSVLLKCQFPKGYFGI
jgi:hypothetical protein